MVLYRSANGAALACAAHLSKLAQTHRIKLPVFDLLDAAGDEGGRAERVLMVTAFDDERKSAEDLQEFWNAAALEQASNRNGISFSQLFVGGAAASDCRQAMEGGVSLQPEIAQRSSGTRAPFWLGALLNQMSGAARS